MKILIEDASITGRKQLLNLIADLDGVDIIGLARDTSKAREVAEVLHPDVAILDVLGPTGLPEEIKKAHPAAKVIVLTNRPYAATDGDWQADYYFDRSTESEKVVSVLRGMLRVMERP